MNISLSYKPNKNDTKLFLRAMIIFSSADDMHLQVIRCKNHAVKTDKNRSNYQKICIIEIIFHLNAINEFIYQMFQRHIFYDVIIQIHYIVVMKIDKYLVNVYH